MLESSFRIGTVAGIRIGVHYTWFIVFLLLSGALATYFRETHSEWSGSAVLLTALVTTLMYFVSIVLHELGHSLVAIARGVQVRAITLFIFGGIAQTEKDADTAATEFYIAIAGPLVSFALAVLFYFLGQWLIPYSEIAAEALKWLATINFVLAVFNLVPGFPLDGGRVFRAIVWRFTGDAVKGMQWAVMGGKVVAYGLMLLGALVGLQPGMLLNGIWLLALGWFLFAAAEGSRRAYFSSRLAAHVPVGEVMQKDVPTVSADMSLLYWIDEQMLLTGQRSALVTQGEKTVGLITLNDIMKCPRTQWPDTSVHQYMTPLERFHFVNPANSMFEVLQIMRERNINQVPVMDSGEVVGWVDREHLLKILELHSAVGH
ncbi:site-2 protease family protein [Nitrosomonas marina]|uniref:Zinc metalloprotease n=1 Tax=Nitrosomonas marina TaxID=917 RepID=A0A1H8BEY0_9PROT|nr:site-2 protease family protein [Nitrosomonas marina]SEM80694.1 Zn-dependent protease (includes SpoIVFB) [Nitrosomonas marina]